VALFSIVKVQRGGPLLYYQKQAEKGPNMSHEQTTTEQQQQQQQQESPSDRSTAIPDPEVVPRAKRRQFTAEYKLRVIHQADACTEPGQIGSLLRREGLYSSYLSKWRQQREEGQLRALSSGKRGRKGQGPSVAELAELQRENERLRARLEQTEIIIDVQKKLSKLLGLTADSTERNESML
jgi:transposase-like protein